MANPLEMAQNLVMAVIHDQNTFPATPAVKGLD